MVLKWAWSWYMYLGETAKELSRIYLTLVNKKSWHESV